MTDVTSFNPHREEDEGYLAAKNGLGIAENPYPRGTIRYKHWRSGWQIKNDENHKAENEGYLAAKNGTGLEANPHPAGTIRYDEWRRGWCFRSNEARRELRLGSA